MSRLSFAFPLTNLDIDRGIVLGVSSTLLGPIAVFAPNGTVVLLAIAALVLAADPTHRAATLALVRTPALLLLMALVALAGAAALWSPDPWRALSVAGRHGLLLVAGGVVLAAAGSLSPREAMTARRGMALGGLLLVGLILIEVTSDGALSRFFRGLSVEAFVAASRGAPFSRGGTVLAVFLGAIMVAVPAWYGRWSPLLVAGTAVAAAAAWQLYTDAVLLGGAVGLATFAVARAVPRIMRRLAPFVVVALLLAPPLIAYLLPHVFDAADVAAMAQSHRHRVEIWSFALERIAERPLFGWGFDASRHVLGTPGETAMFAAAPMSLHAHNITLQAFMELGVGGVALVTALGYVLARTAAGLPQPVGAAALAGLAAALVFAEISRSPWQSWWVAALWLFAAWIAALNRPARA